MSCDLCWEEVDDFDIDAELESGNLVMCSKCRTNFYHIDCFLSMVKG